MYAASSLCHLSDAVQTLKTFSSYTLSPLYFIVVSFPGAVAKSEGIIFADSWGEKAQISSSACSNWFFLTCGNTVGLSGMLEEGTGCKDVTSFSASNTSADRSGHRIF